LDDISPGEDYGGSVSPSALNALACGTAVITNSGVGYRAQGLFGVRTYTSRFGLRDQIREALAAPPADSSSLTLPDTLSPHTYSKRAEEFAAILSALPRPRSPRRSFAFYPDYRSANPYQSMLFEALPAQGFQLASLSNLEDELTSLWKHSDEVVLNVHWTGPILEGAETAEQADKAVSDFYATLDSFKKHGGKIVWTLHNVLPHETRFRDAEVRLRTGLAERSDAIHVLNRSTVELVEPHYRLPRERTHVVAHSSYLGAYPNIVSRAESRAELSLDAAENVFLFFGGIRRYKGLDLLLDVFERRNDPDWRLIVVGPPGRDSSVKALNERCGANPRVIRSFNSVSGDELQVYFNAADVVVLPYRDGLNSGALNLAWSFARPVVAPKSGAFSSLGDSLALTLYDSTDINGLEEAMLSAVQLPRRKREEAALDFAIRRSPEQMAESFARLVTQVAQAGTLNTGITREKRQ
ncbi:MAG: glycosyltransferase, partial [Myxococcota bacterium]